MSSKERELNCKGNVRLYVKKGEQEISICSLMERKSEKYLWKIIKHLKIEYFVAV